MIGSLRFAVIWLALAVFPEALAEERPRCGMPAALADGWEIAVEETASPNSGHLCALIDKFAKSNAPNVHAVVLVRNGLLVFEHYRMGADRKLGESLGEVEHGPDVRHDLRSISKSVVSLLVGIAVDQGLLRSVDQPAFAFFPEFASLRTPEKDRILVRHLLTMSSGIDWNEDLPFSEPENDERAMMFAPDSYRYVWEQPVATSPDKVWNYSGGSTTLLAGIVERVTGKALLEFAREALFKPLGITDVEWLSVSNGQPAAAAGLRLRARDLAKIGQLILDKGAWNGRPIVSAAWLAESVERRFTGWNGMGYGYQWWLGKSVVGGETIEWTAGFGLGGQRLFVIPDYDAAVVITAGLYDRGTQDFVTFDILNNYMLPAIAD